MFYVYEWFIKETGEIIYVGKGCLNRYKLRKHNRFFNDMIKRFDCDSRIVKYFENEQDAFDYEYLRVHELKEIGQCVCNIYEGGTGGIQSWWTDELRKRYSEKNVMKSENQRKRMRVSNPMSNPQIAEKTNGQKRRKVTIGNITYNSIKEVKEKLGISYSNILTWSKKGKTPNGEICSIEPQKQYKHRNMQGNQKPSHTKSDNSSVEGSTTNE
jgi:hypothetical protein